MIETEQQRRWWFATHPEYSSHGSGTRSREYRKGGEKSEKASPEAVDAYVDEALKHLDGPIADFMKAIKARFGTAGAQVDNVEQGSSGWDSEAGGRLGRRDRGRRDRLLRRKRDMLDWLEIPAHLRDAMQKIESELGRAGVNRNDYTIRSFRGKYIAQRNSTFDPYQKDSQGRTNIQRMRDRKAPYGRDGRKVILHHTGQKDKGPMIEVTGTEHDAIPTRQDPSEINRSEADTYREEWWEDRAKAFPEQ